MRMTSMAAFLALTGFTGACERSVVQDVPVEDVAPTELTILFPDAPEPTPFTRAFSMTESPDGTVRVFAQEARDSTFLFESRKQSDGSWSEPVRFNPVGSNVKTTTAPSFAPDGMLYFSTDADMPYRPGNTDQNIWRVKLEADGTWGPAVALPEPVNTGALESSPAMGEDGVLYFTTNRTGRGGHDIFVGTYDAAAQSWTVSEINGPVNSPRADTHLAITRDGERLFFYSYREPKTGVVDIWAATRSSDGSWSEPRNLGEPVNSVGIDFGAGLSGDGKTFFFSRDGKLVSLPYDVATAGLD